MNEVFSSPSLSSPAPGAGMPGEGALPHRSGRHGVTSGTCSLSLPGRVTNAEDVYLWETGCALVWPGSGWWRSTGWQGMRGRCPVWRCQDRVGSGFQSSSLGTGTAKEHKVTVSGGLVLIPFLGTLGASGFCFQVTPPPLPSHGVDTGGILLGEVSMQPSLGTDLQWGSR